MTPSQASLSSIISQSTRRPARRGPTAGPYRGMRQRDARPLGLLPRFLLLLLGGLAKSHDGGGATAPTFELRDNVLVGVAGIVQLNHDPVVLGLAGGVEPRIGGNFLWVVHQASGMNILPSTPSGSNTVTPLKTAGATARAGREGYS